MAPQPQCTVALSYEQRHVWVASRVRFAFSGSVLLTYPRYVNCWRIAPAGMQEIHRVIMRIPTKRGRIDVMISSSPDFSEYYL
jgi:hypothetical protein